MIIFHHVVYYCTNIIHFFISPLSPLTTNIIISVIAVYLLWIMTKFFLIFFNTFNLLANVTKNVNIEEKYLRRLRKLNIDEHTIIINGKSPEAFCFGFIFPKIYFSTKIFDTLKDQEIQAIWIHENYHRTHAHPIKRLVHNITILFYPVFPLIKDLVETQTIKDEILADQAALKNFKKKYLLSSLKKMIIANNYATSIAFFAGYETLLQRIDFINNHKVKRTSYFKSSLLSLMSMILLIIFSTSLAQAKSMPNTRCANNVCASICKTSALRIPYLKSVSLPISIIYSPRG